MQTTNDQTQQAQQAQQTKQTEPDNAPSTQVKMSVIVDRELARAFKEVAKANNRNQSILFRDFMQQYVKKNGQLEMKF